MKVSFVARVRPVPAGGTLQPWLSFGVIEETRSLEMKHVMKIGMASALALAKGNEVEEVEDPRFHSLTVTRKAGPGKSTSRTASGRTATNG